MNSSNQHSDTILELGQDRGALHEKAKVVCKDLLEGWADLSLDDIKVCAPGRLSNHALCPLH